ncbi:MAG: hypothetical protein P4L46_13395 [Fimbriimonas sp.]|nr:hypothetical protein [Fimbriimonas sp.]
MNVFLSAGEASGDAYAAALVSELRLFERELGDEPVCFAGIGGRRLASAGLRLIADSSSWGAISILESLKVVPRVLGGYYAAKRFLKASTPGLLIPIDFGYANIRLARHAKKCGWKVLYFVPPGSWRRDRQGGDLVSVSDAVSTPFSWSADILKAKGVDAHWYGHPIKQLLRDRMPSKDGSERTRIAVLPGSRRHEIDQNLPVIAKAVRDPIEFGLAPSVDVETFQREWNRLAPGRTEDRFTQGDIYAVLTRCRAAVVCSGTATLEAALCWCPMVVIYRFPKIAEFEAKLVGFKRPQFISLPNILLNRLAVPELVQEQATPEALTAALDRLSDDSDARQRQIEAFEELDSLLGPSDAITQTAQLAIRLIKAVR